LICADRPRYPATAFTPPTEASVAPYFRKLMTTAVLEAPGARCYVGEVDREPVTTGFAVTFADFVGIFNIATPPVHRRHGYGAAVTSRAVRDGLSNGASWAWLQSSPAGYPIYERLGFQTVESWRCWVIPQ
jgi:N-acetylglutamate synthase